jgi:hypothetical protein
MKILSSADDLNVALKILTMLFGLGTLLAGVGVFWTDRIIKARAAQESAAVKTSAAKVQADLTAQQERTAKAEKELLQVQERFRPRTMSQSEQQKLLSLLTVYSSLARNGREKNRETLWIVHPSGDTEATVFASMLTGLFSQAGWQPNLRDVPLSEHTVGIEIRVRDVNNPPLLAQGLKRVLEEAHVLYSVKSQPDSAERTWLIIGSKQ